MGRLHADHGRPGPHAGLSRGDNDGALAINSRCHARSRRVRGSGVGCAVGESREARVGGVAQVAGDEKVLIFGARGGAGLREGNGNGWHGRDEDGRGGCRPVRDARNVGDLDDVGGTSEDGRGDRVRGMGRGAIVSSFRERLLALQAVTLPILPRLHDGRLPPRPHTVLPDQVCDDCDGSETANHPTGDCPDVG